VLQKKIRAFVDRKFCYWEHVQKMPEGSFASLEVYDVGGRLVRAWRGNASGNETRVSWNLTDTSGDHVTSGVYLVRLIADGHSSSRKFVVTR